MTASQEPTGQTSDNTFLQSVDLPDINPPPNWSGFTIKNLESWTEGYISLSAVFGTQFQVGVEQKPNGDICVSGFQDGGIHDKNAVLRFLRSLKKQQSQIEIVFTKGPKSPGLVALAREGFRTVLGKFYSHTLDR